MLKPLLLGRGVDVPMLVILLGAIGGMIAYGIIQIFDGNLLAPLLLSRVVNLHPVAIIIAILVFGGLWGIWGVFFAIPLATLVQAVLKAVTNRQIAARMQEEASESN